MSMINDALRRASSVAKNGSNGAQAESPSSAPPIPVSEAAPLPPPIFGGDTSQSGGHIPPPPVMRVESRTQRSIFPWILAVLVVAGVFGGIGFYFWQKQQRLTVSAREKFSDLQPRQTVVPLNDSRNARLEPTSTVTTATAPKSTVVATAVPPAAAVVPVAPVKFPPLRLQSIFYRQANPSVIINGKTLFVMDEINGVKVTDIQPATVTLVLSGQTNILTLR